MQVLTFLRGPNRWVIKCPQHMEQLPVLYQTFPDATFVITHRDPAGSVRYAINIGLYAARILRNGIQPNEQSESWIARERRLLNRSDLSISGQDNSESIRGYTGGT